MTVFPSRCPRQLPDNGDPSASTTAADILQLGVGSGIFGTERILVDRTRYVAFDRWLCQARRIGCVVAGQTRARAVNGAATDLLGESALCKCADRQRHK